jgi:hypothetical protein
MGQIHAALPFQCSGYRDGDLELPGLGVYKFKSTCETTESSSHLSGKGIRRQYLIILRRNRMRANASRWWEEELERTVRSTRLL